MLNLMFPQVLSEDVGLHRKTEFYFQASENVVPAFKVNRKVPFVATEIVNKELDRLEQNGVIKKVNYLKWAASVVCIKGRK